MVKNEFEAQKLGRELTERMKISTSKPWVSKVSYNMYWYYRTTLIGKKCRFDICKSTTGQKYWCYVNTSSSSHTGHCCYLGDTPCGDDPLEAFKLALVQIKQVRIRLETLENLGKIEDIVNDKI